MSNQEQPISLDAYATVLAALGAGLPLPRALAHAEVAPSQWDEASHHWQAEIEESAATDLGLLVAFDAALLDAKRAFDPRVAPIEDDLAAFACFRRHVLTAVDPSAFLAERGLSLGRYARLEADWTARLLISETLAEEMHQHLAAPLEACPELSVGPSPLVEGAREIQPASGAGIETPAEPQSPPPVMLPAPVVPIMPPAPVEPPPPIASIVPMIPAMPALHTPPAHPASKSLHTTGAIDPAIIRAALPFAGDTAKTPSPSITEALKPLGNAELDRTGSLPADLIAKIAKGALPFARGQAPLPAAAPSAPSPAAPVSSSASDTAPIAPLRMANPALPFQSAPRPELSLEQYAALCAELATFPQHASAIFERHGLAALHDRTRVDQGWRERLQKNPADYQRWQALYQRHQQRLAEQQPPRPPGRT